MKRRDFLESSGAGLLVAALAGLEPRLGAALLAQERSAAQVPTEAGGPGHPAFRLTERLDPEAVMAAYLPGVKGPANTPYLYAFYDEQAKKFVNPLDVKPTLDKGTYTLQPVLHAFNVSRADRAKVAGSHQVQLGFNVTAPTTRADQLTWIFMNAVDIFLARDAQGRQDQLTKFTSKNSNATPLSSTPKVTVTNGIVHLQITALGYHRDSRFLRLFDAVMAAVKSPIGSAVARGFGIPALAAEALTFVNDALNFVTRQDSLVPLWQTGSLEFGVTMDAPARYRMRPGLWAIIDADYAEATHFLEDHTVDLPYQSFRITNKAGEAVDANYLVTDMKFTS